MKDKVAKLYYKIKNSHLFCPCHTINISTSRQEEFYCAESPNCGSDISGTNFFHSLT